MSLTRENFPFSSIVKPTGAICNLNCSYCFFLSKDQLYPGSDPLMSEAALENYLSNFLGSHPDGEVTVAWQGGEPTMRGLDFFRLAVEVANRLAQPSQTVRHTIQTNATLITEEWAEFFAANNFLVGVSIDGPQRIHDAYRVNRGGRGSYDQVIRGYRRLQEAGVELNILCTVHDANQDAGVEIYRHFRDELGAQFMQFIPIVERATPATLPIAEDGWSVGRGKRILYRVTGDLVTSRSVKPKAWGAFLSSIFDEWVSNDVGKVYVQHFDVMLGNHFDIHTLCVHSPECGRAIAVEHNGDVYSCDHFVEEDYLLGNIATSGFSEMLSSPFQRDFGKSKRTSLPTQCIECPVRWACHGGCPKDRFATTTAGEDGLNYLCEGYFEFFSHASPAITAMAQLLDQGRAPAEIMDL